MDFSGKSTLVSELHELMPEAIVRHKYLSDSQRIKDFKKWWADNDIKNAWYDEISSWAPLLEKILETSAWDIQDCETDKLIIADNLRVFKILVGVISIGGNDTEMANKFKDLINELPEMDSYYVTASIDEKLKRAKHRKESKGLLTNSDALFIKNIDEYNKREEIYKKLIFERYPNTKTLDTTNKSPQQLAQEILNERN